MARTTTWCALFMALVFLFAASSSRAQFTSSVQGNVSDPSGAAIPGATVKLLDLNNGVERSSKADEAGVYRFVSLAPSHYQISIESEGFSSMKVDLILQGNENRDVPLNLQIGTSVSHVNVSAEAPLLDVSDNRNQYTLDQQALSTLPLSGRNPTSNIGLAPGVSGALDAQFNNNYAPENFIDASANGRGENGNVYIVDGLDVTSNVRPGVTNLTPNADAVQEVNVQTNTYSVQYGRGSGIQTVMTTKAGSDQFHAFASELYTYQGLSAINATAQQNTQPPFHTNNLSFGGGGPLWKSKKFYFFATLQPFHQSKTNSSVITYEDPAFVTFAQSARPNSPELKLLTDYKPTSAVFNSVSQTAQDIFPDTCGTAAADNLPCSTPMIDSGSFSAAAATKGLQYNIRLDKYFNKDRIYGNIIRNTLTTESPSARPSFNTSQKYYGLSVQGNETHTFNDHMINEAAFGYNRIEGILGYSGEQTTPVVNISGLTTSFGVAFSHLDFIQHSYHWRDVVTFIHGSHSLRFGYDGWHGDAIQIFESWYGKPVFQFNNLLDLINNNPYSESQLSYNPVSGQPQAGNYGYAETTFGFFAEDTWKARKNLTLTYGLRYDNFGNPYPVLAGTIAAPFFEGAGTDFSTRIANGLVKDNGKALNHMLNWNFAPRVGVAWDPFNNGKYSIHGGWGVYRDQITLGNMDDIIKGNPPNWVVPTFYNDGSTAAPVFGYATNGSYPFGFVYPALGGQTLDSKGGRVGGQFNIGSTDVNAKTPLNMTWSGSIDRDLGHGFVASVGYVGSHTNNVLLGGGQQGGNTFGQDVNLFSGDKVQHTTCTTYNALTNPNPACTGVQTRLNTSFGQIIYQYNVARANYWGFVAGVRGRIGNRAFVTASYTRSQSMDNAQAYPSALDLNRYYGNSPYDYPNRFSLGGNYNFRGMNDGHGLLGVLTDGYAISGTMTLQSGSPIVVYTSNPYSVSLIDPAGAVTASNLKLNANSGDFNADGNNYDYPNVDSSARISTSHESYRKGVFGKCGTGVSCTPFTLSGSPFSLPSLGALGNQKINAQFRNPGFAGTDMSIRKDTHLYKELVFSLRLDAFNVFNRANFNAVDSNAADGTFGQVTTAHTPRFLQVGGTLSF